MVYPVNLAAATVTIQVEDLAVPEKRLLAGVMTGQVR